MSEVSVRRLGLDDERDAVGLWHEVGLTRPWNDPALDFRLALRGANSFILGAHVDGELAGTAMVGHDGHRAWVYYVGVRENRRRAGVARTLMGAAEEWAREEGMTRVQLMVRGDNAAAGTFYEGLGYRRSDVVVYQRVLDA